MTLGHFLSGHPGQTARNSICTLIINFMANILDQIPEEYREKVEVRKQPAWISPMLAKLTHDEFSDKDWIYEQKLDGVRCLVFKTGKEVQLMSRNKNSLNNAYPELVRVFREQQVDSNYILDGEVVAFREGVTSFSELQKRMNLKDSEEIEGHETAVFFYAFDLVHFEDLDLSQLPLLERKKVLRENISFQDQIRYTPHREAEGLKFLEEACRDKWEGLIAKKADSAYTFGRSSNWLKFKCTNQQEFVIGGYTEPAGGRVGFGSLLLGYYENGQLRYAGKVGTGFTDVILQELYTKMHDLETEKPAFSNPKEIRSGKVHWIRPQLVAQVSFTEWTSGNKLRHPSFLGLRNDKEPEQVTREG